MVEIPTPTPHDPNLPGIRVERLSFDEFARSGKAWDDLALSADLPNPFTGHDWVRVWWEHFGEGQEFVALVVREGDVLLAAVPLALRNARLGVLPFRVGEIVGTGPVPTRGMGLADKADLLVRSGRPEAGERLVAETVKLLDRVDALDLKGIEAGSPTLKWFAAASPRPRSIRTLHRSLSPYLALTTSWDEYLGSRSGNFRKHLRKYWRLLEKAGPVEVERLEPGADPSTWMSEIFTVNASSWKAQRGTNLFRAAELRAFFADLVPAMAAKGLIDLHGIRLAGEAAVYELCFDFGNRLFSYNGSYRADLQKASPGTALTAAVIEAACNRGRVEYDMLRGDEGYKLRWSDTTRDETQLIVPSGRAVSRVRAFLGIYLKARLKQWPWLVEMGDKLTGFASRMRYRD